MDNDGKPPGFPTLQATTVEMTFATKMLPGLTPTPVEDGLERPTPGPEPTPSRDQVAGKEGFSIPPKMAGKGIKGV